MPEKRGFMEKKALRSEMKRRNREMDAAARGAASERIFGAVGASVEFGRAGCVALYCALDDEPPTREVLEGWRAGRRLVVPRVEGDRMRFYDYDPATLRRGAFGIEEPGPAARPCDPSEIDLVVVPGVAFTAAGDRLGRGKGFYDRYLSQPGVRAVKVGVCFAHQLVAELPAEPHDIRMDHVYTDGYGSE